MPRSRTSRSSSPQTQRPQENSIFTDRGRIFQNVREIFQSSLDEEIIRMVLIECNWRDEIAIDKLLVIAEDAEAQKQYKQKNSQLRKIAEGVLGPISFEEYKTYGSSRSQAIPDSKLSPSEKIIGRPIKGEERSPSNPTTQGTQDFLVVRGSSYSSRPIGGAKFNDKDFPKLPSKTSASSSALSSDGSQTQSKQARKQTDKQSKVLVHDANFITQAQSAYNQQYDDAASAQRWEEYKQRISEHYVENLGLDNTQGAGDVVKSAGKVDIIGTKGNEGVHSSNLDVETTRSGRSFPVRLLNKEADEEKLERNRQLLRLDSADLDETILKCIYDVPSEPIREGSPEDENKSNNKGQGQDQGHGVPTPSSLPMTLPVIGLSVEAEEFVPRPKPAVVENQELDITEPETVHSPISASLDPVSKVNRSTPIEIQPGARNIKHDDPVDVSIGSPLQTSSALSPALAQPISPHGTSNPASLTGSPVFLTYKWPHGLQCVSTAPSHHSPILTTSPRYIQAPPAQSHLPPTTFRLHPGPPTMPFPSRVVYPMAPPPFYRMAAGIRPQPIQQMRPPTGPLPRLPTDIDERAAYATGQAIMTPADIQKKAQDNVKGNKLVNRGWINQCQQKIVEHHKDGKKVLVIVRGLPGSGKSFLSRNIKMDGSVLSTDDYFMKGTYYAYNHDKLAESHKWNRERAREAMKMGKSPIIIDNTNTQKWEFKAYVSMALSNNYHVEILEPDTPWKFKPNELAKRNVHGVPKDQIQRMLNRYEHNITVESIVGKNLPGLNRSKKSDKNKQQEEKQDFDIKEEEVEDKGEESGISDDTRMWDISQRKAEHLSRHLTSSPVSNTSRGSSTDGLAETGISHPSSDQHSRIQSPTDADMKNIMPDLTKNTLDLQSDKQNTSDTLNESKTSPVTKSLISHTPPPSIKFTKSNSTERSLKMKNRDVNNSERSRKSKDSEEIESKIVEISNRLSPDILKEVEDMLEAHVKDVNLSEDLLMKREEELTALLQLLPIDVEEIIAAEELIHLKLKSCSTVDEGNNSSPSQNVEKDKEIELVDDVEKDDSTVTQELISETPVVELDNDIITHELEMENELSVIDDVKLVSNKELECPEIVSSLLIFETENEKVLESANDVCALQGQDSLPKDSDNQQDENLRQHTADLSTNDGNVTGIKVSDIEMKYWNRVDKDIVKHTDTVECKWDDTNDVAENWDGETSLEDKPSHSVLIKPQRSKKQRHSSSAGLKIDITSTKSERQNLEINKIESNSESNRNESNLKISGAPQNEYTGIQASNIEKMGTECNPQDVSENKTLESKSDESVVKRIQDIQNSEQPEQLNSSTSNDCDILKEKVVDCESGISDNVVPSLHSSALEMLKDVYSDEELSEEQQVGEDCVVSDQIESIQNCSSINAQNKYSNEKNQNENNTSNNNSVQRDESVINVDRLSNENPGRTLHSASSEIHNKPIQKDKSKKKSNRKLAAKFPEPLISHEDKARFLSKDWTSLSVTQTPSGNEDDSYTAQTHNLLNLHDAVTMTTDQDFRDVDTLNKGGYIDSSLKYLIGSSKKTIVNNNQDVKCSESSVITKVHLVHQSTSTDDLKDMSFSESVKFLKTCFPNVQEDELECVLVNCNDNLEWAINLLLDWKYSLHLTDEEKEQFVSGMGELQSAGRPVKQPSSLTDLCFQLIEKQNIASREEIEEQLIETSKERLDRIEDDNIHKIRLLRSSSLNESVEDNKDSSFTNKVSPRGLKRSQSVSSQHDKSPFSILNEILEEQDKQNKKVITSEIVPCDNALNTSDTSDNIGASTADTNSEPSDNDIDLAVSDNYEETQNVNIVRDLKMEKIKKKIEMKEFVGMKDNAGNENEDKSQPTADGIDGMDDYIEMGAPAVSINLSTDIIRQLEKMFGPVGTSQGVSSLPVPLDHTTALRLYQCIKHGIVSFTKTQLQMQEDAEMARRLQDEENAHVGSQQSQTNGSPTKYVPLSRQRTQPNRPPIKSLETIMKEEEAEERKKQEFQKMLEYEGGPSSMSTRVKRLQLYDKYPSVDRPVIDRIFEANCFNMSETEDIIKWSLGHSPGKSRTEDSDLELDKSLIESTKQQSMQEMLDSYIYKPQVSKDYQDGVDPEYEDYRGEANLHYRLRHECFQKAQAAFRQGLKQVASFYSQQGHLHTQKIKEANMRASEQILADRNADLVRNGTLDLHGLHIDEVIAALKRILPDLQQDYNKKYITIITGRGSHSKGGIARLRPSVIAYLKRFHFSFSEELTGVIRVNLKHRRADR